MDKLEYENVTGPQQEQQSLIDCYRIALDFGLAAGNLAAEQVKSQNSHVLDQRHYSNT